MSHQNKLDTSKANNSVHIPKKGTVATGGVHPKSDKFGINTDGSLYDFRARAGIYCANMDTSHSYFHINSPKCMLSEKVLT